MAATARRLTLKVRINAFLSGDGAGPFTTRSRSELGGRTRTSYARSCVFLKVVRHLELLHLKNAYHFGFVTS